MSNLKNLLVGKDFHFNRLKEQFKKEIAGKNVKMLDGSVNVKANIKGNGGTTNINKTSVLKSVGVTDFMNGKLDQNTNIMADMVKLEFGNHATETNPAKVTYSSLKSAAPVGVLHARLVLRQDNQVLFSESVSNLLEGVRKDGIAGQIGYMLENPFLLVEQTEVVANFEYPEGISVATDKEYFTSLTIGGEKTALK